MPTCPSPAGRGEQHPHPRPAAASAGHPRQVALEVASDALGVIGRQPIGLVEHDHLAIEPGQPLGEEVVVEDRVVVLLRVRDPDDRIDARQDRLDPFAVLALDRVEVRQIEDRDVAWPFLVVVANLLIRDAEPAEQPSQLRMA